MSGQTTKRHTLGGEASRPQASLLRTGHSCAPTSWTPKVSQKRSLQRQALSRDRPDWQPQTDWGPLAETGAWTKGVAHHVIVVEVLALPSNYSTYLTKMQNQYHAHTADLFCQIMRGGVQKKLSSMLFSANQCCYGLPPESKFRWYLNYMTIDYPYINPRSYLVSCWPLLEDTQKLKFCSHL